MPTPYQGVFNVTDGVDGSGNVCNPLNSPGTNTTALQYMISELLTPSGPTLGQGGTLQFPSAGVYQFSGSPIVIGPDNESSPVTQPYAVIIEGTGQGSQGAPLLEKTDSGDLFQVNNGSGHVGGITFRDLQIAYSTIQTSGAAIHVLNGENVRVWRCILQDCPIGVHFEESLQGSMINCTVLYPPIGGTNVAGIGLQLGNSTGDNSAIETHVAGCVFQGEGSPSGSIAIQINNVEHVRVINTRMEEFERGIVIAPGGSDHSARKLYFGNVSDFSGTGSDDTIGTAVLIQPTNGSWVGEVWFDCCELDGPDSGIVYRGAGVVLDPVNGAGGGGVIDQVRFVSCHVCRWNGPGLQIIGGTSPTTPIHTNIEILGGFYSLNGADPLSGLPSAGIAVSGSPAGIRISGSTCNNTIYFDGSYLTATQDYGISIGSGAQNVSVRSCDLQGNITQAVAPISSVTNVQITDCAGYNDQGTPVRTTPPGLTSFSGVTFGYYGPVEFYVTGGSLTQIAVNGHNTNLTAGSVLLMPNESAQLTYSGVPSFLMIGK